jgi:hypothetical protein
LRIYPTLLAALLTLIADNVSKHFSPENPHLGDGSIGTWFGNLLTLQGHSAPTERC